MAARSDPDTLIDSIYAAVAEPVRLKEALGRIVAAVNACGAHLVGVDRKTREVVLSSITGLPSLGEVDYNERYARVDPRLPICFHARVGEWISCHEYLPQAFVDENEFFQDFYVPYGCRFMSAVKLVDNDRWAAILGVHRGVRQQPLPAEAFRLLNRLTPHLQRALGLIEKSARLQTQRSVIKATLDGLAHGALVCDTRGQIYVANDPALALLADGDGLSLREDRIWAHEARAQARLTELLSQSGHSSTAGATQVQRALAVPRLSRLPSYQLIFRKVESQRSAFAFEGQWLWSVLISDPNGAKVPTALALAVLYDLTPAEARLATLVTKGYTPERVAEEHCANLATVRSQLSSLFSKTGTRHQAELVRLFSSVPQFHEP
ncbi:MAG: helix-turn-helix transcriptional regulator [Burkholderiales bacterium]